MQIKSPSLSHSPIEMSLKLDEYNNQSFARQRNESKLREESYDAKDEE
jgi:hypothetical protein